MPSSTASDYLNQKMLDKLFKGIDFTEPATIWVALMTTVPNLDGTGGVEVSTSGTGYGRKSIVKSTGWVGPSGTAQTYSNAQDIVFDTPTNNWGTIRGIALYDAETSGNLLFSGTLVSAKAISATDNAPIISANQLRVSRATC